MGTKNLVIGNSNADIVRIRSSFVPTELYAAANYFSWRGDGTNDKRDHGLLTNKLADSTCCLHGKGQLE